VVGTGQYGGALRVELSAPYVLPIAVTFIENREREFIAG